MPSPYLTKSDYKVARTCPTKLYYRKLGYPTITDSNEFLAILAEQGYLVEALARLRYPTGQRMDDRGTVEQQAKATAAALHGADEVTLFEATIICNGKLARIDILVKQGNTLRLIEIKSTGYDSSGENGQANGWFWTKRGTPQVSSKWRPYLEDVTFQSLVLREYIPDATIIPYLVVLDSSQPSATDHLQRLLDPARSAFLPAEQTPVNLVLELDVSREVEALIDDVQAATAQYLTALGPLPSRLSPTLSANCRDCEFHHDSLETNGFRECWGDLADVTPHILDLFSVGTLRGNSGRLVDALIAAGKASLYDIPVESIVKADGTVGAQAERQLRQIRQTRLNEEWVDSALGMHMKSARYPLHFIDFETCSPTIPRYSGMRPFETIAFQWSCHTITYPGADMVHAEWLQTADSFPNPDFARSLREHLGEEGTILVWSSHEHTVLQTIIRQLNNGMGQNTELIAWLDGATAAMPNGRMLDMHKLATNYYYHPRMGGRTSVKSVCEAVWYQDEDLRGRYPEFMNGSGAIQSPYRSLPGLSIQGEQTTVRNGTGAVLAYMQMMGDGGLVSTEDQRRWRHLLSQYCRLDTLAMVMIWEHWQKVVETVTK